MTEHSEVNRVWLACRRAVAMEIVMESSEGDTLAALLQVVPAKKRGKALELFTTNRILILGRHIIALAEALRPDDFNARCRDAGCGEVER